MNAASVKTLIIARHSLKTADGNHISPAGLELIEQKSKAIIGDHIITKGFHTTFVRTHETLKHLFAVSGLSSMPMLQSDTLAPKVANDYFDNNWDAYIAAWTKTKCATKATLEAFGQERIEEFKKLCADGIKDCFSNMNDGETAIGICHTPYVELANNFFGGNLENAAELEFTIFIQQPDGTITVQ